MARIDERITSIKELELKRRNLAAQILNGYRPTKDGCPPFSSHWGGYPLSGRPWLDEFASLIAKESRTAKAWLSLEGRLNTSLLIELLYLFTLRENTSLDEHREDHRILKKKLESIIPAYDNVIHRLSQLIESPGVASAMGYASLTEDHRQLVAARERAEQARQHAASFGSNKTNTRDWYLFLMACEMKIKQERGELPRS